MINDRKIEFVGLFVFHKLMMSPQKSEFRKHGYSLVRVLTEAFGEYRTGKGVMPGVRVLCQVKCVSYQVHVCYARCMCVVPCLWVVPVVCVLCHVLCQVYLCCTKCVCMFQGQVTMSCNARCVCVCFRAR